MGLTRSTHTDVPSLMSTALSRATSRPTCRCRRRQSTNWTLTSKPPRRSGSRCRPRCSLAPTRSSNDGVDGPLRHLGAKVLVDQKPPADREPSMYEITTVGLDLAKNVFQVHAVDAEGTTV